MARGQRQAGGLDARQQLRPEHLGQRLVVEQIAPFAFPVVFAFTPRLGSPLPLLGIDRRRRHDQMDVGMEIQFARMGVQHRDGARRTAQRLVVPAERVQRLPTAAQEQIVAWMLHKFSAALHLRQTAIFLIFRRRPPYPGWRGEA